jgi:hypothetical protein
LPAPGEVPMRVRHAALFVEINIRGPNELIGNQVGSDVHAENLLLNSGVK